MLYKISKIFIFLSFQICILKNLTSSHSDVLKSRTEIVDKNGLKVLLKVLNPNLRSDLTQIVLGLIRNLSSNGLKLRHSGILTRINVVFEHHIKFALKNPKEENENNDQPMSDLIQTINFFAVEPKNAEFFRPIRDLLIQVNYFD